MRDKGKADYYNHCDNYIHNTFGVYNRISYRKIEKKKWPTSESYSTSVSLDSKITATELMTKQPKAIFEDVRKELDTTLNYTKLNLGH